MNYLKEELQRLIGEEKELEFLLKTNKRQQAIVSARLYEQEVLAGKYDDPKAVAVTKDKDVDLTKPIKKPKTKTVAEKLGNSYEEERFGQRTIISYIVEAMEVLEEPLDLKTIQDYVLEHRDVTAHSVYTGLHRGFHKGIFKKTTNAGKIIWSLNEPKVVKKTRNVKKGFTRPNYGISKAIADVVNQQEPGIVFTPASLLGKVKSEHEFRQATEALVDQTIQRWIKEGKPGIEPKPFGDNKGYIFKQKLRL